MRTSLYMYYTVYKLQLFANTLVMLKCYRILVSFLVSFLSSNEMKIQLMYFVIELIVRNNAHYYK